MNNNNPKVDAFIGRAKNWKEEIKKLRQIALDCNLDEELKWGKPTYVYENSNIVIIQPFKDYCAFMFFKGSLLEDGEEVLIQPTKNMQAQRQVRFTSVKDIEEIEPILKAYIHEAIEAEKKGLKVDFKDTSEFDVAEEFQIKLDGNPELEKAFKSLTPGRQRAYLLHFSGAKQSKTRLSRVEKYIPKILDGKGMND